MCGIAGFVNPNGLDEGYAQQIGSRMGASIAHRGPDDRGIWTDPLTGTVLVHRRLAILDLSAAGHQPMRSASGRYVIVYNGEIYNHNELRHLLNSRNGTVGWQGHSDTETLLACIDAFGLEDTLKKLNGMFALAVYDHKDKGLYLARDRAGEKPIYYGTNGDKLYFASELKAIRAHPEFKPRVNRDALSAFLRHNYVPAPLSIYEGIHKLPPGSFVRLDGKSDPVTYWSFNGLVASADTALPDHDETASLDALDALIRDAVGLQMQADVPLGAFLSGGIDSSLIVALMQERSSRQINSFSIGFNEREFDEAPFAKAVAAHIGTHHTEFYVSGQQAIDVVPRLPSLYDEPFSDSSQIPTFLVSQMAREHVTVALSGDAGDELFGGYNRYSWAPSIWRHIAPLPMFLKRSMAAVLTALPPSTWNVFLSQLVKALPDRYRHLNPGDRLHKVAEILAMSSPMDIYLHLISHWKSPDKIVIGATEPGGVRDRIQCMNPELSLEEKMMLLDSQTYLPDDILVKVDRAAMGVSLETRVPFLDHRVIECAWRLPLHMKIRNGVGKWCLRQLLYKRVPKDLIERPKTGFGVPLERWLRTDLRDWAGDLLSPARLTEAGYFQQDEICRMWDEHQKGSRNWQYYLWDILMFESWREEAGV